MDGRERQPVCLICFLELVGQDGDMFKLESSVRQDMKLKFKTGSYCSASVCCPPVQSVFKAAQAVQSYLKQGGLLQ